MISEMLRRILDVLSPRCCAMCGQRLPMGVDTICMSCNFTLPRTNYASDPYENDMAKQFCAKFKVERAAAWFYYRPKAKTSKMVHDLKYHNHPQLAQQVGYVAATEFADCGFFEGIDMIIPVPITKKRKRERGYNQCLEIARGVNQATGIPIADDVLQRSVFVKSQTYMSAKERIENVKDAFKLIAPDKIKDRHVLLIDDIVTTGSTLSECGYELAKADNVRISIMALGKTR